MTYQKLAAELLARCVYAPLRFAIGYLPYLVREIDIATTTAYDAIAEAYLTILSEHEFATWPKGMPEALIQIAGHSVGTVPSTSTAESQAPAPPRFDDPAGFTLLDAFLRPTGDAL